MYQRNIIKFQAWTDSRVHFPYIVRAPLDRRHTDIVYGVKIITNVSDCQCDLARMTLESEVKVKCNAFFVF